MTILGGLEGGNRHATKNLKDDYGLNGMGLRRKGFGSVICVCLPVCWETTERGAK